MTHVPSRRAFLATGGAVLLSPLLPRPAAALTPDQGRALVSSAVAEINGIIASGQSEAQMIQSFAGVFDRYADVPTIALYTLGVDARRLSGGQRGAFVDAFRGFIAQKYGRRFREFIGGEVVLREARAVQNFVEVETTAVLRGQAPFRVDFHVSDRSGRPAFFNLVVEGVNMLLSERTEMGAMLDRQGGNLDALIADLRGLS